MVAQHKIRMRRHQDLYHRAIVEVFTGNVWFFEGMAIDIHLSLDDSHAIARGGDHAFDVALGGIERVVKHDDIAAADGFEFVDKLIDEDALLVLKARKHAGSFDAHRLIEEDDKEG